MQQEQAANKVTESAGSVISQMANEFLTFRLGGEEYGIEILKVQEIRGYDAITQIANAPDFIKGVVNLRGIIVPIVDMRIKFRLGDATYDQFTVVIILNVAGRVMGLGTVDERMLILIDIEKFMGGSAMGLIEQSIN